MIIYCFKEHGGDTDESITEHFSKEPYTEKEEVLFYLKNCGEEKCFCGLVKDVIDGSIHGSSMLFRDKYGFSWNTDVIYHVEKYNFRPDEKFISHVLKYISENY